MTDIFFLLVAYMHAKLLPHYLSIPVAVPKLPKLDLFS